MLVHGIGRPDSSTSRKRVSQRSLSWFVEKVIAQFWKKRFPRV